mgnify:CR=1 FL=1
MKPRHTPLILALFAAIALSGSCARHRSQCAPPPASTAAAHEQPQAAPPLTIKIETWNGQTLTSGGVGYENSTLTTDTGQRILRDEIREIKVIRPSGEGEELAGFRPLSTEELARYRQRANKNSKTPIDRHDYSPSLCSTHHSEYDSLLT